MRVRIIIDSTTDLAPELRGQVEVVPLTVSFGTEEYIDGVTITHEEFYNKLIESDVLPTTSQATPAAFEKVFKEVAAAGDTVGVGAVQHSRGIGRGVGSFPAGDDIAEGINADGETGLFHFTYKIVTALPVIIGEGQTVEAVLLFADGGKGVQMLLKSFFAYHGRSPLMMLLNHIVGKNHSFDKKRLTLFSIMLQFMRDFLSQSVFQSK